MKTTVKEAKGGKRDKTLKEEKRDITRSLKSFGKKVVGKLKGNCRNGLPLSKAKLRYLISRLCLAGAREQGPDRKNGFAPWRDSCHGHEHRGHTLQSNCPTARE